MALSPAADGIVLAHADAGTPTTLAGPRRRGRRGRGPPPPAPSRDRDALGPLGGPERRGRRAARRRSAARLAVGAAVARLASTGPDDGRGVADADRAVRAGQAADCVAAMAATLTLAAAEAVDPAGSTWHVANVGDSPAWLVPATGRPGSHEDNLAAELVRTGAISPDEARRHPGRHW